MENRKTETWRELFIRVFGREYVDNTEQLKATYGDDWKAGFIDAYKTGAEAWQGFNANDYADENGIFLGDEALVTQGFLDSMQGLPMPTEDGFAEQVMRVTRGELDSWRDRICEAMDQLGPQVADGEDNDPGLLALGQIVGDLNGHLNR